MNADSLSTSSRAFYERSKAKLSISLVLGAGSMMLLGFCSNAGGQAASYSSIRMIQLSSNTTSIDALDASKALIAGYGFSAFVYILGFILLAAAAIYTSPLFCGTINESKIIKTPQEMSDAGSSGYGGEPYNRAVPASNGV